MCNVDGYTAHPRAQKLPYFLSLLLLVYHLSAPLLPLAIVCMAPQLVLALSLSDSQMLFRSGGCRGLRPHSFLHRVESEAEDSIERAP